jgi:hypothetical protein
LIGAYADIGARAVSSKTRTAPGRMERVWRALMEKGLSEQPVV